VGAGPAARHPAAVTHLSPLGLPLYISTPSPLPQPPHILANAWHAPGPNRFGSSHWVRITLFLEPLPPLFCYRYYPRLQRCIGVCTTVVSSQPSLGPTPLLLPAFAARGWHVPPTLFLPSLPPPVSFLYPRPSLRC
jgi:hypothetical protein